jgi:hypothetical protein
MGAGLAKLEKVLDKRAASDLPAYSSPPSPAQWALGVTGGLHVSMLGSREAPGPSFMPCHVMLL